MSTQLAIDFDRGARGMRRAAEHAERESDGWIERAVTVLRTAAQVAKPEDEFTIEQLRADGWSRLLPEPPDLRAWGSATQIAARRGFIEKTGGYAPATSSNGSPKPLYRKGRAA